jgi:hypothetical protein
MIFLGRSGAELLGGGRGARMIFWGRSGAEHLGVGCLQNMQRQSIEVKKGSYKVVAKQGGKRS